MLSRIPQVLFLHMLGSRAQENQEPALGSNLQSLTTRWQPHQHLEFIPGVEACEVTLQTCSHPSHRNTSRSLTSDIACRVSYIEGDPETPGQKLALAQLSWTEGFITDPGLPWVPSHLPSHWNLVPNQGWDP